MPRYSDDASQRRRTRRPLLRFFVATALLALLPFGVARWQLSRRLVEPKPPYQFPINELIALDQVIQARFAESPTSDFGIMRVADGNRHGVFVAKTNSEKAVVASLRKRGLEVVFYVAGRNYLEGLRSPIIGQDSLQGPVFITGKSPLKGAQTPYSYDLSWLVLGRPTPVPIPAGMPNGESQYKGPLKAFAKKALEEFETGTGMDFQTGKWKIAARPVRASQQACLDCHNRGRSGGWGHLKQLQLGDTLGVAMYAYRTKSKGQK